VEKSERRLRETEKESTGHLGRVKKVKVKNVRGKRGLAGNAVATALSSRRRKRKRHSEKKKKDLEGISRLRGNRVAEAYFRARVRIVEGNDTHTKREKARRFSTTKWRMAWPGKNGAGSRRHAETTCQEAGG